MIRILNAEPDNYSPEARQILTSIGQLVEKRLSQTELLQSVSEFDVLIVRLGLAVNGEVIKGGHRLRAIVTATTGVDHIDVDFAQGRGIAVLSLKGEKEFLRTVPATAEHTWALLLALVRNLPQAVESVRAGDWDRDAFRGRDLEGKRLGILGLGRVGAKVARYGLAFSMRVAAFDAHRDQDWPGDIQRCSTLDELLRRSDVLSLHVPLNAETHHLIGERELALLPQGAVLINTARGSVLDEMALVK
ncbi:phosphoglycerate dehydrogenase, partial [bacterium]|nr:phosphoglycerate dehydrogenase [bacterium]